MAKISELSLLANPRGDERLPVIDQNGETRGANIGPLVNAAAGPALARADEFATRSGQSAGSANLFASAAAVLSMLQPSVAAGIAATPNGRVFGILSGPQVALLRNDDGTAADTGARFGTPEIHVETQGAIPYPLGTDSTAAIRAALDLAAATGGRLVGSPIKQYAINGAGVGDWPAGVEIGTLALRRSGAVTGPALRIQAAGRYIADGLSIEEAADHSSQNASIEVDHPFAQFGFNNTRATKGYAGIWVKQCFSGELDNCDFGYSSHPIYLGRNDVQGLGNSYGYADNITLTNTNGHHAKAGGDGLKTVSRTRNLNVNGGRFYANNQDGIDLFAGCMKARFTGVRLYDNRLQGFDIKVGDSSNGAANYPEADWGERRDITIDGCFMDRNGYNGVKVFGDDANGYFKRVVVTKCQIDMSGGHGIVMRGIACTIDNSTVRRSGQNPATAELAGISVQYDNPTISGLRVVFNTVIDNGRADAAGSAGMLFTNCSDAHIAGNFTGNVETTVQRINYFFNGGTGNLLAHAAHLGVVANPVICSQAGNIKFGENCGLPVKKAFVTSIPVGSKSIQVPHGVCCRPSAIDHVVIEYFGETQNTHSVYPGATAQTQVTAQADAIVTGAAVSIRVRIDMRGELNPYPFTYAAAA